MNKAQIQTTIVAFCFSGSVALSGPLYPAAPARPAVKPTTQPATRPTPFRLRVDMPLVDAVAALGEGETIYEKGTRTVRRWTVNGKLVDVTFRDGRLNDWEDADDSSDGDGTAVAPGGFAPGMKLR